MHFFRSDSRVSALQSSTAATGAFGAAGGACLDNVGQVTLVGRGVRSLSAHSPHAPVSRSARRSQESRRPCQCFARVILTATGTSGGLSLTAVAAPRGPTGNARRRASRASCSAAPLAGGITDARSTRCRSFPVVRVTVECLAWGPILCPFGPPRYCNMLFCLWLSRGSARSRNSHSARGRKCIVGQQGQVGAVPAVRATTVSSIPSRRYLSRVRTLPYVHFAYRGGYCLGIR